MCLRIHTQGVTPEVSERKSENKKELTCIPFYTVVIDDGSRDPAIYTAILDIPLCDQRSDHLQPIVSTKSSFSLVTLDQLQ